MRSQKEGIPRGDLLHFVVDAPELTVYNPTKPIKGKYISGRMEPLTEQHNSKVVFFERHGEVWKLVQGAPTFKLQDPFHVESVDGYHVFGGVQVFERKDSPDLGYRTLFYRYKEDLSELKEPFCVGPDGMKDIRLIQIRPGSIAVFTRPQGGEAGPGKIGYTEVRSINELTAYAISNAPIIQGLFTDNEWGGANELHLLKNGKLGVLGHIAQWDGSVKHYYAMTFVFDPKSRRASGLKLVATADMFPAVKPKNGELGSVVFSGGLVRSDDKSALIYAGVGDVAAGVAKLHQDPFLEYELQGTQSSV